MQICRFAALLILMQVAAQDRPVLPAVGEPAPETQSAEQETAPAERQDSASELDQILDAWEKVASKIRRLDAEFTRFKYDKTFEVEKRAAGTVVLEGEKRARYRTSPGALEPPAAPKKNNNNGRRYDLKADEAECWYWTGTKLIRTNEFDLTYEVMNFPLDGQSWPVFMKLQTELSDLQIARAFLLGLNVRQLKRRFRVVIEKDRADEVWLTFSPRVQEVAASCIKAKLIMDRRTWLPKALLQVGPTGSAMVHVFRNVRVNSPIESADDLSKPNLDGYRQIGLDTPQKDSAK